MNFNELFSVALQKAGKHETLATELDLSPSGLSRRINGEIGWQEKEINKILAYTGLSIIDIADCEAKIITLKKAMRILLNGEGNK